MSASSGSKYTQLNREHHFLRSQYGRLFLFILFVSAGLAGIASVDKRNDLFAEHSKELTELNLLVKRAANDRLLQMEVLFKNLGQQINNFGSDTAAIQLLIDEALDEDPIFIAYGMADINGNLLYVSEELRDKTLPNLLESEGSARSFRKTLVSNHITVGDTYFFKPLERWLIPFRYAMRTPDGEITLVVTTAIALEGIHNPWRIKGAKDDVGITVTSSQNKNGEFFPIYFEPLISPDGSKDSVYQKPLPEEVINEVMASIQQVSGLSFEEFTRSGQPVAYTNNLNPEEPALAVLSHDLAHDYYLGIRRPISMINGELLNYALFAGLMTFLFNGLSWFVLRREYRADIAYNTELETRARQDYLTGLPNRFAYEEDWQPSKKLTTNLSTLYIDLDNFRFINDHFGHAIGDRVLVNIASNLDNVLTTDENLYRLGGDEFLVVTKETDPTKLQFLAEHILYRINEKMLVDTIKISLSASIGICTATGPSFLEQLMIKADHAMYQAKKIRNQFAFFDENVDSHQGEVLEIENQLGLADLAEEIEVVYQPQITSSSSSVVGVEVLARWHNEKLGQISPAEFIPVAEKAGRIIEIGEIVIEKAFRELQASSCFDHIKHVSLNISVHQFMYGAIAKYLNQKAAEFEIPSKNIMLEITESLFVEDFQYLSSLIQEIRRDGYKISLDDFGTGYSSLSVIRSLDIDELKIDKSFVDDILDQEDARALIQSIIGIGKNLHIPVLAEGTENAEQAAVLAEFGCDRFQGYHFAKPMPIEELVKFLRSDRNTG